MNARIVAHVLCVRTHRAEWEAPVPRKGPCEDCLATAVVICELDTVPQPQEVLG